MYLICDPLFYSNTLFSKLLREFVVVSIYTTEKLVYTNHHFVGESQFQFPGLPWFSFSSQWDWSSKHLSFPQLKLNSKLKTITTSLLPFSLAKSLCLLMLWSLIQCLWCNWQLQLLWFWLYDTESRSTLLLWFCRKKLLAG